MPRLEEALDLGLWTAPDPALLRPGMLSDGRNFVYLPGSKALQRARGRSSFGEVTGGGNVDGLRSLQFDNGDAYLIALASGLYRTAPVGDTGTFTTLVSGVGSGAQLEVVHYRNRFYLFNGIDNGAAVTASNRVVYLSATAVGTTPTVRPHGLLPVLATPTTATGSGSFSQVATGYYEYWTTEVAKLTQDGAELILESTFEGKPANVFISATSVVPTIQQPTPRNAGTTHWRIYRSPKKDTQNEKLFPSGFMVAEMSTATASAADGTGGTSTSFIFASAANAGGNRYADVAGASDLFADDGIYATFSTPTLITRAAQGIYGFNFGTIGANVVGMEVRFQAFIASGGGLPPAPITVTVGSRRQSNGEYAYRSPGGGTGVAPASKSVFITATASPGQTVTLGATNDPWTPINQLRFSGSDFAGDFMVVLETQNLGGSVTVSADFVSMRVTHGATLAGDSEVQFPAVSYQFGDITAEVGKNGAPPNASTADMYEDSLVCNDVGNPALIRWSYPGDPEAFPSTYFIDFETHDNDQVTLVKTVNEALVVGMKSALARLNYLPSERDSSFDRGKAFKWISRSFGVVNPMCACSFSPGGGTEMLAFVSDHGIHGTDGFSLVTYSDGLDWRGIIPGDGTSTPICLINDRERQLLLFYYRIESGNETYRCLSLSYHSDHLMEGGKLKVGGPIHMRNFHAGSGTRASLESAWAVRRSTGVTDVYLGYGGTATAAGGGYVYRETGTTIPAEDPRMSYVTRRFYPGGFGNEVRVGDVYGYAGSYTGSPVINYTLRKVKTNDGGEVAGPAKSLTLAGQKLHKFNFSQMVEGFRVSAITTASAVAQEMLVFDIESFGKQDSGL